MFSFVPLKNNSVTEKMDFMKSRFSLNMLSKSIPEHVAVTQRKCLNEH